VAITKRRTPANLLSTTLDRHPVVVYVLSSEVALIVATAIDRPLWQALLHIDSAVSTSEWGQALRALGYLPVWLVAAFAIFLIDRSAHSGVSPAASRAPFLATSVIAAVGMGEILKMLIRRLRPDVARGEYLFRPFIEDTQSSSGLGMPSGHAMVAFAAVGCAATRVLSQAHFVSDTVLSAVVAFAVVRCIWRFSFYLDDVTKQRKSKARP